MTFKDGGAYDFNTKFLQIKERLQHAVEVARESGQMSGDGSETGPSRGGGALSGINMAAVHLEQLPAYEEATTGTAPISIAEPAPIRSPLAPVQSDSGVVMTSSSDEDSNKPNQPTAAAPRATPAPLDPPPGYEEVQRACVATELERSLRDHADDQGGGA